MKEIMIATSNAHKVEEFKQMLKPLGYQVKSLLDLDEEIDIEENGTTFEENALIKAALATSPLARPPIPSQTTASITSP